MKTYEPLYDKLFHQLEQVRWTLATIPFNTIDQQLLKPKDLAFVRVNCCYELSSLYATRMFLRDFQSQPDFCQFMSIWYYEEMKHYLVLREYLKVFDMAPNEAQLTELNVELKPAPWSGTLAMHFCGELRLGMWYRRWSDTFKEPVLKQIYHLISQDEYRHANCYKLFMQRAVEQDSSVLLDFLQMAKWMMYNPTGDKHPTTLRLNSSEEPSVKDLIPENERFETLIQETIFPEDEEKLRASVLSVLSTLSGKTLSSLSQLAAYTRELQRQQSQDQNYVCSTARS